MSSRFEEIDVGLKLIVIDFRIPYFTRNAQFFYVIEKTLAIDVSKVTAKQFTKFAKHYIKYDEASKIEKGQRRYAINLSPRGISKIVYKKLDEKTET